MNLFKKIIILVNLILCMLCINVFADTVSVDVNYVWNNQDYTVKCEVDSEYASKYVMFQRGSSLVYIVFSLEDGYIKSSEDRLYIKQCQFYQINTTNMPVTGTLTSKSSSSYYQDRTSYLTFLSSNYDIYYDTGELFFANNQKPVWDDTTIDWESAFEYRVIPAYTNETGKGIEHMGDTYDRSVVVYTKGNSFDGLLYSENTESSGYYYLLDYDFDFVFTDSKGNESIKTINSCQVFNDEIVDFEFPYLVSSMADDEQYSYFGIAVEGLCAYFFESPFANWVGIESPLDGYSNVDAWYAEQVEKYVDSYGYFDYDLIFKPKVIRLNATTFEREVIYTYDEVSLIYDVNNPNFISPEDAPSFTSPDGFDDIGVIIDPDNDIWGGIDDNDDYDVNDDGDIVDKDGNVVADLDIDKENDKSNWTGPNGEDLGSDDIGGSRPNPDEITDGTIKDKKYDITGVIRGLKEDLQELVSGDGSLAKMFAWFRQIFEWLPFDILSIFGMIIAFFIIFEFIHIIRK